VSSARYRELVTNVAELRRVLLPAEFDPTGNYTSEQRLLTSAFRLLAHGEIEAFVEDRSKEVAQSAWANWSNSRHASRTAVALIAFSGVEMSKPPATLLPQQPSQQKTWPQRVEMGERLNAAVTSFLYGLRQNHGIKEENVLSLLLPVGFDTGKLDQAWLASVTSFGVQRGSVAHSSVLGRARNEFDPKQEFDTVLEIVTGLERIDDELESLLNDTVPSVPLN
jgi:hypothetical protein